MANNSGVPQRVINSLERATSGDANEFQLFGSKAFMELFRKLFFSAGAVDANGWQVEDQPVVSTTPLTAYVAGGLLVDPQGANLLVEPGTIIAIAPDPAPDSRDSVAVVAHSDGVNVGGLLPFTANGGAGPRWDLLECRPIQQTTTATRDIFDIGSQQFNGTTVDKLVETVLEFRIAVGTPASPTAAPTLSDGWLPIAAIWTPNTAASFDDCEVFDIRPLIRDLSDYGASQRGVAANEMRSEYEIDGLGSLASGSVSAKYVGPGRKWSVRGPMRATEVAENAGDLPAFDLGLLGNDVTDSRYWEQGTTSAYNAYFHMSLVFPFGLPRWRRLGKTAEAVSGKRRPTGCGGFLVFNTKDHGLEGTSGQVGISNGYDTTGTFDAFSLGVVRTDLNGAGAIAEPATCSKHEDGWIFWALAWFTNFTVDPDSGSLNESFELDLMTRSLGVDAVNWLPATVPVAEIRASVQMSFFSGGGTTDAFMETTWFPEPKDGGFNFGDTLGKVTNAFGATDPGGTGYFFPERTFAYDPKQVTGDDTVQIIRNGVGTLDGGFSISAWAPYLKGFKIKWTDAVNLGP